MKVIVEVNYLPEENSIIWLFHLLKKSGIDFKVLSPHSQTYYTQNFVPKDKIPTIAAIKKIICTTTGMDIKILESNSRQQDVVENRQISMYLSRIYTRKSLREIGNEFGNKNPATILHACKVVKNLFETDKKFREKLNLLECQVTEQFE